MLKADLFLQIPSNFDNEFDFWVDSYDSRLINTSFPAHSIRRYDFYAVLWLKSSSGRFIVDFQTYEFSGEKMIFLSPGQFFNVQSGKFEIIRYAFRRDFFCVQENNPEVLCNGVLFNHVYQVASIDIITPLRAHFQSLNDELFRRTNHHDKTFIVNTLKQILTSAVAAWQTQSPFHPDMTLAETEHLFALKKAIDRHLKSMPSLKTFAAELNVSDQILRNLIRRRVGMPMSQLVAMRQVLEARRELCFTDKSVKTIAFYLGFNDPAYFNRFFKKNTGQTPEDFRHEYAGDVPDSLLLELQSLIEQHFRSKRQPAFYAQNLYVSTRTLTDILKRKINNTCTRLIRQRLLLEAKRELLQTEKSVKAIAAELNFEEPGHFSRFFSESSGVSPAQFRLHKNVFSENLDPENWMFRN